MTLRRMIGAVALLLAASALAGILTAEMGEVEAGFERPPALGKQLSSIPSYPQAEFMPLGERVNINGLNRQMAYGHTPDPPRKVADRYESLWRTQGLTIRRYGEGDAVEQWVVATSGSDDLLRTVGAVATAAQTTIIASVRKVSDVATSRLPRPEQCRVVTASDSDDPQLLHDMALLECKMPIAQLLAFYDGTWQRAQRLSHREPSVDDKRASVTYQDDAGFVAVLLAHQPIDQLLPATQVSLSVQRLHSNGAPR